MPAIVCEDVSFRYRTATRDALCNLSFALPSASVTAVMGASGSGKSTLLKILAGIIPTDRSGMQGGQVLLDAKTPREYNMQEGVGYVFQEYRLLPFLTVVENAVWPILNGRRRRAHRAEMLKREAEELIEMLGLSTAATRYPRELSGGMKARAALVRALVGRPTLLLIDEAFSALDIGWRIALHSQLRAIRSARALGMLFISHDIEDACAISDRVIVIDPAGSLAGIRERGEMAGHQQYVNEVRDLLLLNHPAFAKMSAP